MVEYSFTEYQQTITPLVTLEIIYQVFGGSNFKEAGYNVLKLKLSMIEITFVKSMLAWEKFGNGETPETTGLKEINWWEIIMQNSIKL